MIINTVDQRGRMDRVTESFVSPDNLKDLAVTVMSAALTAGISHQTGIKITNMNGFTEQLKGNAVKGLSNFAVNTAVHGKAEQAFKTAAIQVGVDTASGTLANKIGLRREAELENGDLHRGNFGQESATLSQLSSLTGQLAAELSGLDASAALRAGENAVENNCLPFLAVLASGGGGAAAGGAAATGTAATVGSTLAYYGSALLAGLGLSYLADKLSENAMDAAPEGSEWVDEGVQTEEGRATILSTPGSIILLDLEGYTPAQFDRRYGDEGFQAYHGPDASVLTRGELPKNIPQGTWTPPEEALEKIPDFLGEATLNRDGKGFRWLDNERAKFGIRIDQGDPNAGYAHQRVDHVRVTKNGQVIGRDGNPILSSSATPKPKNTPEAHIPLEEWKNWTDGFNK